MMIGSEKIDEERKFVEDAFSLMRSEDWYTYVEYLKGRVRSHQLRCNEAVMLNDIVRAQVELALMRECQNQASLFLNDVKQKAKQLTKSKE